MLDELLEGSVQSSFCLSKGLREQSTITGASEHTVPSQVGLLRIHITTDLEGKSVDV